MIQYIILFGPMIAVGLLILIQLQQGKIIKQTFIQSFDLNVRLTELEETKGDLNKQIQDQGLKLAKHCKQLHPLTERE